MIAKPGHITASLARPSLACFRPTPHNMPYSKLTSISFTLPEELKQEQLTKFPAYKTWLSNLNRSLDLQKQPEHPFHKKPYQLRSITVQSCDYFGGGRLGFVKLKAEITNDVGESLPGIVFLRGGSVAMMIIVKSQEGGSAGEEYVILTVQPRAAGGSMGFVELPAGMIDDSGSFGGAAAKEIMEETGLEIKEDELVNLTELALANRPQDQVSDEGHLEKGVYPSPGASDEFIPIFLARRTMSSQEIDSLKGKLTGLRDEGEKITLKVCLLQDLWKVGARDGKTLAAVALYEGLKREGKI